MDTKKLIEEQKKTREAIKLLQNSKTYEELLKKIPEEKLDWKEYISLDVDEWDYKGSSEIYDMKAAYYIMEAVKNFGKAKYCLEYVKRFYEGYIKDWEEYREYCKTLPNRQKGYWKTRYENPVCLKFFEDYEKANGIENSIYKELYGGKK